MTEQERLEQKEFDKKVAKAMARNRIRKSVRNAIITTGVGLTYGGYRALKVKSGLGKNTAKRILADYEVVK